MTEKEKQPNRVNQVQMQFKRAIDDIENQTLSPNLVEVNKQLKKTKDQLDLRNDDKKMTISLGPSRLLLGRDSEQVNA